MSHPAESPQLYCQSKVAETDKKCHHPLGYFVPGRFGQELHTHDGIPITTRPDGIFIHCPKCGGGYVWFIGPRPTGVKRTPPRVGSVTGVAQFKEVEDARLE